MVVGKEPEAEDGKEFQVEEADDAPDCTHKENQGENSLKVTNHHFGEWFE
jgi:hypothetical protein